MRSTRKTPKREPPAWLESSVYEGKRQRTFHLVKQAVDVLVNQREQDGTTRVSLTAIVAMSKQIDPEGKGVAHTSILENAEAYTYYKRYRTASPKSVRQRRRVSDVEVTAQEDPLFTDPAFIRRRQHYMTWRRAELVRQLLIVEQERDHLHEQWLDVNDQLLQCQLRLQETESQLATTKRSKGKKNAKHY